MSNPERDSGSSVERGKHRVVIKAESAENARSIRLDLIEWGIKPHCIDIEPEREEVEA